MNRKKKTEEIAKEALLIIIFIITTLLIVATGCHNKCTHKDVYVPRDTTMHENENVLYWEWDSVMDSVDMGCGGEYHGKEGKSEYGEYDSN